MSEFEVGDWIPAHSRRRIAELADEAAAWAPTEVADHIEALAHRNADIHLRQAINLNPAANTMNPRAEALLASGLGSRPSLGYPGAKYETGLQAIEAIEVAAAQLACQVFGARFAEVRVGSGALANLYAFMACTQPGDTVIVPSASIGGHITHHQPGAAGLYGLNIHTAPTDAANYTIDLDAVAQLAQQVRPSLITIGGSLNLAHHPVRELAQIAHDVGARLLFDAAHLSGLIAGGAWPNPLANGADIMTMSAYKSLAGPQSGLLLTNDADIARRVDQIAFPGLTANFDAANTAALAVTLADWMARGGDYAAAMVAAADRLAAALDREGLTLQRAGDTFTRSHAFAVTTDSVESANQQVVALEQANLLVSTIGVPGDGVGAVRVGTNEMVRFGIEGGIVDDVANLFVAAWRAGRDGDDAALRNIGVAVTQLRSRFRDIHYCA